MDDLVKELVQRAADKYPIGTCYKGRITEEQMSVLDLYCDVHCFSVYMDGRGMYEIRYRK